MNDLHNRRAFLRAAAAAGVAWAAADALQVEDALAWAGQQAASRTAATTTALTKAQADVVDALVSRIIPSVDGRPGAHEAGAAYFIDRALGTFNASQKTLYADGIADLNRRAAARAPGTASFAALPPAVQDEVLREIDVLGPSPTNICFGGRDGRTAYVTEVKHRRLVQFRVDRPGLEWKRWQAK